MGPSRIDACREGGPFQDTPVVSFHFMTVLVVANAAPQRPHLRGVPFTHSLRMPRHNRSHLDVVVVVIPGVPLRTVCGRLGTAFPGQPEKDL